MPFTRFWKISHAIRIGTLAGFAALLLWPIFALYQEPVRPAFVAALALAAFCGGSILVITLVDMATVRRGRRMRPARAFDLALGAVLVAPSVGALTDLLG